MYTEHLNWTIILTLSKYFIVLHVALPNCQNGFTCEIIRFLLFSQLLLPFISLLVKLGAVGTTCDSYFTALKGLPIITLNILMFMAFAGTLQDLLHREVSAGPWNFIRKYEYSQV